MIRLQCSASDQRVRTLLPRFRYQKFQLARLVAAKGFTFFGSSCSGAGPRIMRLGTGRLYNSASLDSIALVALKQVRERSEKFA